jgi:hypothetical protein
VCVELPPASVKSPDFHKHLLPDLPGPVKMRQLMVWAVLKAAQSYKKKTAVEGVQECLLQGLLKNELETSWYGRGAAQSGSEQQPSVKSQHPQNVELMDTISQVKQYHTLYPYNVNSYSLYLMCVD